MGILDNILSAGSGGLLGGRSGSKKLWGTSINQDTPVGTLASNMASPLGSINQQTHMLGVNSGNPLMSNTQQAELLGLLAGGAYAAPEATGGGTTMGYINPITGEQMATGGLGVAGGSSSPSTFSSAMGFVKPIAEAAGAANAVKGLLGSPQPLQPSPMMQPQNGSESLNQIVNSNNQNQQLLQQQNEQERARRMALLALFGGKYGTS